MRVAVGVFGHKNNSQFSAEIRKDARYKKKQDEIYYKELRVKEWNLDFLLILDTQTWVKIFKICFEAFTKGLGYMVKPVPSKILPEDAAPHMAEVMQLALV